MNSNKPLSHTEIITLKYLAKNGETRFSHDHDIINDTAILSRLNNKGLITVCIMTQTNAITEKGKAAIS